MVSLLACWRHQMETFSASLAFCGRNSPITGELPSQRPVTRNFDVFFDVCLNKRLNKHLRRRWFETPSRAIWRHCNGDKTKVTLWKFLFKLWRHESVIFGRYNFRRISITLLILYLEFTPHFPANNVAWDIVKILFKLWRHESIIFGRYNFRRLSISIEL